MYSGQPGLAGSSELYSCVFTFTKVAETIKSAANKLDTPNAITVTSSSILGGTLTIVVKGMTGTIGAGPTLDPNMMWISPVSRSSWPTSALRLTSTAVEFWDKQTKNSGDHVGTAAPGYVNQLQFSSLSSLAPKLWYTATYTFKIIGKSATAAAIAPIAQITSGTQVKHTDMGTVDAIGATVTSNTVTINASMTKSVNTTTSQVSNKTRFDYTIRLINSGATAITFDSVVDTPASGLTYVAGSVRLAGASTTAPSLDTSNKLVFSQPITVSGNSSVDLTYTMEETSACSVGAGFTYANNAIAKIGTIVIGATSSTYPNVSSSGTCGTATIVATTTTPTLPVEVVTLAATTIANTSANMNATIDSNGTSGLSVIFEYGTSPSLSTFTSVTLGATTTTAAEPYGVSTALSSLASGTTYYYRVRIGTVYGDILSFVTTEPVATPTVVTNAATSISATDATLNATVDPNQTAVYVDFEVSTVSDLSSGVSIVRLIDDPTVAYNATSNPYSQYLSSTAVFPQINFASSTFGDIVSGTATALSDFIGANNTVYFRARTVAVTGGAITTASEIKSFTFSLHTDQTITLL